jgi:hypothetical protein
MVAWLTNRQPAGLAVEDLALSQAEIISGKSCRRVTVAGSLPTNTGMIRSPKKVCRKTVNKG